MAGIESNGTAFLTSFQDGPHQKLFFQGFYQNSASKMANCTIVDIVNVITGKLLATLFVCFLRYIFH